MVVSSRAKLLIAAVVVAIVSQNCPPPPVFWVGRDREPDRTIRRKQSSWWQEMNDPAIVSEAMFRAEARLPREVFWFIVEAIENDRVYETDVRVGARALPVAKQLMAYLLRVGSNTTSSIVAHRLGISASSVPVCIRRTAKAIIRNLKVEYLQMALNQTPEKAKVLSGFKRRQFEHCVGIIDCTHVRITVPARIKRRGNGNAFIGRKKVATLTYQAVTTAQESPRFLDISGGLPGAAYDTRVMEASYLYNNINLFLEGNEYILGDLGYPLRPWLMTGFTTKEVNVEQNPSTRSRKQRFNKFLSGVRIGVERAFGILKARFKGLREQYHVRGKDTIKTYHSIFLSACILHNVCAEKKVPLPAQAEINAALAADAVGIHRKRKEKQVIFEKVGGSLEQGREKRQRLFEELF
jgi:hypothetical protein